MSALTEYFFDPVVIPRSALSVVGWWERRRPVYNVAVGSAGLVSLGALKLFAALPPHPANFVVPWFVIAGYAVLANACYSLGPAADLFIRKRWGNEYAAVGPTLFRYGFVFSAGLTLLPTVLAGMSWVVRILLSLR
jgi:hypothetical protein